MTSYTQTGNTVVVIVVYGMYWVMQNVFSSQYVLTLGSMYYVLYELRSISLVSPKTWMT